MDYNKKRNEFFNNFYKRKRYNSLDMKLSSKEEFDAFLKVSKIKKGMNIIELGCGDGRYILPLLQMGCHVTGVDIAENALNTLKKIAEENNFNKLKTLNTDFVKSKNEFENKYDIGYIISTFHLLSNDLEKRKVIFGNFMKTVKKGGRVIILEPNPLNPLFYPFYILKPHLNWELEKTFIHSNRWKIYKIMKDLKLKNIHIIPYGLLPGFLMNKFIAVKYINRIGSKMPIINLFSTFNFFIGEK